MNYIQGEMMEVNIDAIAASILDMKTQERNIADQRKVLESKLAALIATKQEGTDTKKTEQFKITVTSKLSRSLDYSVYQGIEDTIPEGFRCVKMKPEIDLKKLRLMDDVKPGFSAQFITTKPATPAVKIEVM